MDKNNNYLLGQYEKSMPNTLTLAEKLQYSKQFGFDYLEMSIDESDEKLQRLNWNDEQIRTLKDDMERVGQPIKTICLSGHRRYPLGHEDEAMQKKSLNIGKKAIDLAERLGVRIIQLAGYDVYYEKANHQTQVNFLKNLQLLVDYAAKKGVMLGFETMETPFMDTVAKSMHYVEKINSPYLGIYPDIGNLKNASLIYHNCVNDDLSLGKGHIMAAHLKETKPQCYREIPFGSGHTEYLANIEQLVSQGVYMYTGEWWATDLTNWEKDCQQAHDFLRDKLDTVINKKV